MRALWLGMLLVGCGSSTSEATPTPDAGDDAIADTGTIVEDTQETSTCGSGIATAPGTVLTDLGVVEGSDQGKTWAFRAIPFAAPPTGALRFKPPQPATCWNDKRAAKAWGAICPQLDAMGKVVGNEDCLTLNVWTPKDPAADKKPRAVMVFMHGGGHVQGSAAVQSSDGTYIYDGEPIATQGDVVVVTIQFRLGPLGYLAHPALTAEDEHHSSGMLGALDQIAALKWVQKNIASFGGDPSRVTIFGESAGGVAICTMIASPLAKGLFSSAIMESGGCPGKALKDAEAHGVDVATKAGCTGDIPKCLRSLSVDALLTAIPATVDVAGKIGDYNVVVDGYVLPETPLVRIAAGTHNHVPFVFGSNTDETSRAVPAITTEDDYKAAVAALAPTLVDPIMAEYPSSEYGNPRRAFVALTTDAKFVCPLRNLAKALIKGQTEPGYRYVFAHPLENGSAVLKALGAWHGGELPYVFGHLALAGYTPGKTDIAVSNTMIARWSQFAKTGDPGSWPKWDATDPYLRIDEPATSETGVRTKQCDFWDGLGL
ncbi:MAG: carboxylesterase/lipase family protein [Polyangiales bacterium]